MDRAVLVGQCVSTWLELVTPSSAQVDKEKHAKKLSKTLQNRRKVNRSSYLSNPGGACNI